VNYEPGDVAGVKDVTLFIKGRYAFGYLSAEMGFIVWYDYLPLMQTIKGRPHFVR